MPDNLTALLNTIRLQFSDRLLTSDAAREHHGSGESHLLPAWPDAVVMVTSTQDVSDGCCQTNDCKHQINRAIEIYALNN
jgi:D-lactate dehydrogenase (cytochrome)